MPTTTARVVADGPLAADILDLAGERVTWLPWQVALEGSRETVDAVYTYGHPRLDGAMLDRLPGVRVISNYGVGVDHIVTPFNQNDAPDDKLSIVDIKARDKSGRQFYIEMQMLATGVFRQRSLDYWAWRHQDQLHESEDYAALRPTIAVCFVDTPLFPELDDYHLTFELRERRHQTLFTDQMEMHILELPKFNKGIDELTTPLDRWPVLLAAWRTARPAGGARAAGRAGGSLGVGRPVYDFENRS
ncbi:MAG TPA: Rpn family recombination-promoting nuclease/putative transposase [Pirellulales bacterium]|nr:Rpn family recombination-promoting nuclease/putative transposase [Pirellulales bacterium]